MLFLTFNTFMKIWHGMETKAPFLSCNGLNLEHLLWSWQNYRAVKPPGEYKAVSHVLNSHDKRSKLSAQCWCDRNVRGCSCHLSCVAIGWYSAGQCYFHMALQGTSESNLRERIRSLRMPQLCHALPCWLVLVSRRLWKHCHVWEA